jgi:hypothetical protein
MISLATVVLLSSACDGRTTVSGVIRDSAGHAISGARIEMKVVAGTRVATTESGEDGAYKVLIVHAPVGAGEISLTVAKPGYQPVSKRLGTGVHEGVDVTLYAGQQ